MMLLIANTRAQSSDALLARLIEEDKASIDALVLYPDATRNDILQASQYPELVVRISEMQKLTSQQFSDLLSPYAQADQERFWELARYPQLVQDLAAKGGIKEDALKDYPEIVQTDARWADKGQRDVMVKMDGLYDASQNAFETLLSTYPAAAQKSFRNLVNLPEVLSILSDDLKMTVLVGDLYKRDPAWVIHKLDSLNVEVARKNAEELQAWRDSLSANPQALKEFQESSEEFRQASGAPAATEQQVTQYTTNNNYYYGNNNAYNTGYNGGYNNGYYGGYNYYNPYPWWYGYPTWYDYPYWYPQPYWSHSGYYYGAGGVIIVYGMPSPYYTHWYFNQPWHHSHYPHLTHHMLCYNEGHRDSPSGFHREVDNWVSENQNVFGKDWLKNDAGRPGRIKEFGQFEVSYHNEVATHPTKAPTEQAYFESHVKDYPKLNATVQASPRPAAGNNPAESRPTTIWPTKPNTDARPVSQPKNNTDAAPVNQPKNNTDARPVSQPKNNTDTAPVYQPKNNTDAAPVYQPKNNTDAAPVYQPKPNTDARPVTQPQNNTDAAPVYQPKPNTDMGPNNPPKNQPQYEPQPRIERPPQNQIQNNNPAPSYHKDSWQRVEPRPTIAPQQQVSPRQNVSPKQLNRR